MASYDLINAFDDCLERLRAGQSVEDCLRAYPQYAAQLRPMLEAGLAVRRATPAVSAAARARVRARVMPAPSRQSARWRSSRITLAAASILVALFVVALMALRRGDDNQGLTTERIPSVVASATNPITSVPTEWPSPTHSITPMPTETPSSTPTTRDMTTTVEPSVTPEPTDTPTPSPTLTLSLSITLAASLTPAPNCQFRVTSSSANVRRGPGTGYGVVGFAYANDSFVVLAAHTSRAWYEISYQDSTAWIAAMVGEPGGDCASLPVSDTPLRDDTSLGSVTATPGGDQIGDGGGTPGGSDGGDDAGDDDGDDDSGDDNGDDDGGSDD